MAWDTSNRRERLPSNWAQLRRFVLSRDKHRCQVIEGRRLCLRYAREVHHRVEAGDGMDDDSPENLMAICSRHHKLLTHIHATKRRLKNKETPVVVFEGHPGIL